MQNTKAVAETLHAIAQTIEMVGFPEDPLIVQGDPQAPFGFFLVLWKPKGKDRDTTVLRLRHDQPGTRSSP